MPPCPPAPPIGVHGKHAPGAPFALHNVMPVVVPSGHVHCCDAPGMHVPPPPLSSSPPQATKKENPRISAP
jgi:hypothetical protein